MNSHLAATERDLIDAGRIADLPARLRCLCDQGRRGECRRNEFCAEQTARHTEKAGARFFPLNWSRPA